MKNFVSSEIGTIRKILIHSPDGGIGKIIPSKFEDWLYDDTVHLKKMREEYDEYIMLLLHFMDKEKATHVNAYLDKSGNRNVFMPDKKEYFNSDKVIDVQKALSDILEDNLVKIKLVSAVCAIEGCSQYIQNRLEKLSAIQLAKTLITGILKKENKEEKDRFIFPPVPNLVFTRDIGILIKDHILLSKSAKRARKRESLIVKYIALFHEQLFAKSPDKIIEITEESDFFLEDVESQQEKIITIEGGDIMMISEKHLIVGCSERTSKSAVDGIIHKIFGIGSLEIEKISVVKIPPVRAQMHIDTIFTQIKAGAWVLYGGYSEQRKREQLKEKFDYTAILKDKQDQLVEEKVRVIQFYKQEDKKEQGQRKYLHKKLKGGIEALLRDVSMNDFGVAGEDVKIIYSGRGEFPYDRREQWTDSCNLVALKDGVVIGYDRNEKTIGVFGDPVDGLGFDVFEAKELLKDLKEGKKNLHEMENTLILLSSSELSRARGGSHCMSMPLCRDKI